MSRSIPLLEVPPFMGGFLLLKWDEDSRESGSDYKRKRDGSIAVAKGDERSE
jgi:hypothetical protein